MLSIKWHIKGKFDKKHKESLNNLDYEEKKNIYLNIFLPMFVSDVGYILNIR